MTHESGEQVKNSEESFQPNLKPSFFRSLKGKIVLTLLATSMVVEGGAAVALFFVRERSDFRKMEQRLPATLKTAQTVLREPLWNMDDKEIKVNIGSLLGEPWVQAVSLRTDYGKLFEVRQNSHANPVVSSVDIVSTPEAGSRFLGRVTVEVSPFLMRKELLMEFLPFIVVSFLSIFVALTAAFFAIDFFVTRDVVLLSKAFQANSKEWVAKAFLRRKKKSRWPDELDVLVASMNNMKSDLAIANVEREKQYQLLLASKEAIEQSSRAKSVFLAKMSHEIRTPLNGIVGSLQMLETSPNALVSRELVGMASSSAAYLQSFIERVLETARRESTAFEIMKERFSLGEHFSITLGMVEHDFEAAGLVLTTRLDSNLPPVLVGDPVRLRQIMLNLLSNAEKYTKKGMVSVELSLVSLRNNVCELKIDVVDTGCGIPPEAHQRIFEVFSQEDNDVLKPRRGVGLGLAITKKIVKELGGEISLESAVGKGSRFTVVLPFGIDSANNDAVSPVASEVL